MNYSTIKYTIRNSICVISLNRPDRMNAVNEELYLELQDILESVRDDSEVRVIVITGSVRVKDGVEKQAFCAGADLKKHSSGERDRSQKRRYIEIAHETTGIIYNYPRPVIAAVNGPARGAGTELAICCDFILMSDDATIGFPETGLGTFVGGGVTKHLPRVVGLMKAKELIFTGRILNGIEAVESGIALFSCPIADFYEKVDKFALSIAEKAPISVALAKKHINESGNLDIEKVLRLEAEAILSCMETGDWQEGVDAFSEKRKPLFKGR